MTIATFFDLPSVVDVRTVQQILESQPHIHVIDVRTPAEYETAHIVGSHNIPLDLIPSNLEALQGLLCHPTILVCRSGARAQQAAEILQALELDHLHVLGGGVMAWEAAQQPLKRGKARWSLERQVRGVAGALVATSIIGSFFWRPLSMIAGGMGIGLFISALTDSCTMAALLSRLPYNRQQACTIPNTLQNIAAQDNPSTNINASRL